MTAYYNEIDPYAAEWLRNLIAAGHIAPGEVDERDIREVRPDDLGGYAQVHLFAGIGGWSYALRLAGWPDDEPVWTGSCPCQPFSVAGKGAGAADARHLWPEFRRLVAECRPATALGEQVVGPLGRTWLAGVRADLEEIGYAVGAADLPAACVGAPHIRQRLWWVAERLADTDQGRCEEPDVPVRPTRQDEASAVKPGADQRLADAGRGSDERGLRSGQAPSPDRKAEDQGEQRQWRGSDVRGSGSNGQLDQSTREDEAAGSWNDSIPFPCIDGKARRVPEPESGVFPLAHGAVARMGRLRAYGNAIVPQVAAAFIRAYRGGDAR